MSGRFVSCFAGIGGFDLAFERAGWECVAQVEIDPACRKVLAHHWPNVTRFTDIREVTGEDIGPVDAVVGGWPCQDHSVAGPRAGLAGQRSGLFHEFVRLARECRARWIVGENVPGALSSGGGRDMGVILGALAELGMGYAYRVLDAQYFGVPQRRRRVFVVGHLGVPWSAPAEVLFEPESLRWDPAPGEEARADVAATLGGGAPGRGRRDNPDSSGGFVTHALTSQGSDASEDGTGRGTPLFASTLVNPGRQWNSAQGEPNLVTAFQSSQSGVREVDAHATLDSNNGSRRHNGIVSGATVRRLTPLECARLQGFPDDWLDDAGLSSSAKYRTLGNAVPPPVVEWIARRLTAVDGRISAAAVLASVGATCETGG